MEKNGNQWPCASPYNGWATSASSTPVNTDQFTKCPIAKLSHDSNVQIFAVSFYDYNQLSSLFSCILI